MKLNGWLIDEWLFGYICWKYVFDSIGNGLSMDKWLFGYIYWKFVFDSIGVIGLSWNIFRT